MDERGLSKRGLAKLLAGEGASVTQIESHRRQIGKHLNGEHSPNRVTAIRYARVLGLPNEYFVGESGSNNRMTNEELIESLLEARLSEELRPLQEELAALRAQLEELRGQDPPDSP